MSKPILIGVDPLAPDRAPVILGSALGRLTGAPLVLVGAYLHDRLGNAVSGGQAEHDLREEAAKALTELAQGLEAETAVAGGFSAAHVLHELALARDARLVVTGSSRRGRLGRIAPG